MMPEQLQIISRIMHTQDGKDFLEQILKDGQKGNYNQILMDGKQNRDELIGYGNCLRDFVGMFENCDIRLEQMTKPVKDDEPSWA